MLLPKFIITMDGVFRLSLVTYESTFYVRAGVIVMGICPDSAVQTNFIDYDSEQYQKLKKLDEAIDRPPTRSTGAREVQGECRAELARAMLSRSLHSQCIFP